MYCRRWQQRYKYVRCISFSVNVQFYFSKMHELPAIPNPPELAGQWADMVLFYAKVREEVEAILQLCGFIKC